MTPAAPYGIGTAPGVRPSRDIMFLYLPCGLNSFGIWECRVHGH